MACSRDSDSHVESGKLENYSGSTEKFFPNAERKSGFSR